MVHWLIWARFADDPRRGANVIKNPELVILRDRVFTGTG